MFSFIDILYLFICMMLVYRVNVLSSFHDNILHVIVYTVYIIQQFSTSVIRRAISWIKSHILSSLIMSYALLECSDFQIAECNCLLQHLRITRKIITIYY